jgi:hypothetical protein
VPIGTALVVVGLLAGCAQPSPPEWAGRVCTALVGWVEGANATATVTPTDLTATQQAQAAALGAAVDGLGRTGTALAEIGESPVDGGDAVLDQLRTTVQNQHAALSTALAEVAGANPHDPIPFTVILERSSRELISMRSGLDAARAGFDGNAALQAAAKASPSCQPVGFGGAADQPPA